MSNELPSGWVQARLSELVAFNPKHSADLSNETLVSFVPMAAVSETSPLVDASAKRPLGEVRRGYTHFADDDVLFAKITPCMENGKGAVASGLTNGLGCGTTELVVMRSRGAIDPTLLYRFLAQPAVRREAKENFSGTAGQARVPLSFLENVTIQLAPLAEQRRIVAKLEKLLARVDACQRRLKKFPGILKRFRQSVLAAACSGRLTADWRNADLIPDSDAGSDEGRRFAISPGLIDEPEIPDSWDWTALGNAARCFRGRFTPRPRNDPRFFDGPHPFIQIGALPKEGGFITAHSQTLNDDGLAVSRKFPAGTTVIAIVGATIGNTGVLAYDTCATDSLVGVESGTSEGNRYLEFYLRHVKQTIREASYSSGGQPNIKLELLNSVPVALPPLAEQREIVRRVDALFAFADKIEARFAKAKMQVDKLTPALLAKAFRGELVPQDPDDEPASALLDRIRAGTVSGDSSQPRRRVATTTG